MPEIHVDGLTADPPELDDLISQVANVEGTFRIESSGEVIYSEECFPVAELARQLLEWSAAEIDPGIDFEFDSMYFEERGIVWIRRSGRGWRIGSIEQSGPIPDQLSWSDVRELVRTFVEEVIDAGKRDLHLDLTPTVVSN